MIYFPIVGTLGHKGTFSARLFAVATARVCVFSCRNGTMGH